jgi:hypothetical protein
MRKRFLKIVHKQARIFVTRVSPFDSRRDSHVKGQFLPKRCFKTTLIYPYMPYVSKVEVEKHQKFVLSLSRNHHNKALNEALILK